MGDFFYHFDLVQWVTTIGYFGLFLIVLLETGFFFGFFLPGDSLMFTAGLLASKGIFNIWVLLPSLIMIAILGYTIGYWFGNRLGHWLLKRKDSVLFKKSFLDQAHAFYHRHGGKALIFGRLMPVVRTFVPIVAGMGAMRYRVYLKFNIIGALLWAGMITLVGYFIGSFLPNASHYIFPVVIMIVFVSVLPGLLHYLKNRVKR